LFDSNLSLGDELTNTNDFFNFNQYENTDSTLQLSELEDTELGWKENWQTCMKKSVEHGQAVAKIQFSKGLTQQQKNEQIKKLNDGYLTWFNANCKNTTKKDQDSEVELLEDDAELGWKENWQTCMKRSVDHGQAVAKIQFNGSLTQQQKNEQIKKLNDDYLTWFNANCKDATKKDQDSEIDLFEEDTEMLRRRRSDEELGTELASW
jgi:uncharacterized protein YnzC (UPF0291/DUF896 family)